MFIFLRKFKIMTYKLIKDSITETVNQVRFTDSNGNCKLIPFVEENKDYLEYLEWVAQGNKAEEAD